MLRPGPDVGTGRSFIKQIMKIVKILALMLPLAAAACHAPQQAQPAADAPEAAPAKAPERTVSMLPRALVYKTSVPCADNVAISLNPAGNAVQSYPAPGDVTAASAPVELPGGWYLDRRGLGPNTAFISLTYEEYSRLKQAPSPEQLMKMIIPGAEVTEMRRLDMSPSQAVADTAAVIRALEL